MKKILFFLFLACSLTAASAQKQNPKSTSVIQTPAKLVTSADSMQYILGAFLAQWLNNNGFVINNSALFSQGINDMFQNKPRLVPDSTIGPAVAAYQRAMQKERAIEQEKQLFNALRDRPGVGQLPNGVRFIVLKSGRGQHAIDTDSVVVHLAAKLLDGTKVEDTYQTNKPFMATINSFFPGLNDALPMMPEGAKWQLFVPAVLAYGEKGTSLIPPNSALVLEVELLKVIPGKSKEIK